MNGAEIRSVACESVPDLVRALLAGGGRMRMVYAWHPEPGATELCYLATPGEGGRFLFWRCRAQGEAESIAAIAPAMGWYEREIMELYGVTFRGQPEPNPLLLADGVQRGLPELGQPEVQLLPFGPVRADVVESAEFTFFYIGERILHFHPQLFFKHRGMESHFAGLSPAGGAVMAERVSAVGGIAHALAYSQAIEAAFVSEVPKRARLLRTLLAELERIYNHLHYLGHLAGATTLRVGEAEGKLCEEKAKQINARLTGSRFLRNLVTPGGLRRDILPGNWVDPALDALRAEAARYIKLLQHSDSHRDRLITTGRLSRRAAREQGATGPVGRASGIALDLRRDHPYAAYAELPVAVAVREEGDADARSEVRMAEIDASIALARHVLRRLEPGPVRAPVTVRPGAEGLGWAESPRGALFYAVHVGAGGRLQRVKIKSPSFSNWRVFPLTVHETNMMDYAINEASFGLTVAGCAR